MGRVVLTGAGALSALGTTPDALWQGLLAGRTGVCRVPAFVELGLEVTTGGEVKAVPRGASNGGPERDEVMAGRVIDDALSAAGLDRQDCGFLWGAGLDTFQPGDGQVYLRSPGACFAALAAPFGGPRRMMAVACATGTQALGEAYELVRRGRAGACVAGGSSVMLTPFYLVGFARLGAVAVDVPGEDPSLACRPFDQRRRGFALADGAGAVVVEALDSAERRGAEVLAEVVGFGTSQDAFDLNRPPADGAGAELAMRRALDDAGLAPGDLDAVNAHGTATLAGDQAEAVAIRRLLGESWKTTPVSSAKGALGHAMAAAGVLEAIISARTCATGVVPPTVNLETPDLDLPLDHVIGDPRDVGAQTVLSVSLGMGGQNAAIVLRRASKAAI